MARGGRNTSSHSSGRALPRSRSPASTGAKRELQPIRPEALGLRRGGGPAGVPGTGREIAARELADRAEQRDAQIAVRGELVLEESGRQHGQPAGRARQPRSDAPARSPRASRGRSAPDSSDQGRAHDRAEVPARERRHAGHAGRHAEPEAEIGRAIVEFERTAQHRAVGVQRQHPAHVRRGRSRATMRPAARAPPPADRRRGPGSTRAGRMRATRSRGRGA